MTAYYSNIRVNQSGDRIICDRTTRNWTKKGYPLAEVHNGQWEPVCVPDDRKKAKEHLAALNGFLADNHPPVPVLSRMSPEQIGQALSDKTGLNITCSLTNSGHLSVEVDGEVDSQALKKLFKIDLKQSTFYRGLKTRKAR